MSELGILEGRVEHMNSYQSLHKAEAGLSSDRLPWEPREFTPALQNGLTKNWPEIISSIDEAGKVGMVTYPHPNNLGLPLAC